MNKILTFLKLEINQVGMTNIYVRFSFFGKSFNIKKRASNLWLFHTPIMRISNKKWRRKKKSSLLFPLSKPIAFVCRTAKVIHRHTWNENARNYSHSLFYWTHQLNLSFCFQLFTINKKKESQATRVQTQI